MKRLLLSIALACASCQTGPAKSTVRPTTLDAGPMQMSITAQAPPSGDPRDPRPQLSAMVHLDVYLLDMPAGSISGNRDFWKRVDEQAAGAANEDRLLRNGIRCGVAPRNESNYFRQYFSQQPHHARRSTMDGFHTDTIELEMEKKFDQQDLFFFNPSNLLEGRTYEHGTNQWVLTFGPTPRNPNAVRITLCPEVYSQKTQMRFTPLNQEYETPTKNVDRLYDLGMSVDVSNDNFLIIAPSSDATRQTSIGGTFLMKSEKTQKLEQVIVIVPTFLRLDGKPMLIREGLLK